MTPVRSIDLNADLGENAPERVVSDDEAMLKVVTSASISCGAHAGTEAGIRAALTSATARDVVIGAHPSYLDRPGFGRVVVDVTPAQLQRQIEQQLETLQDLAANVGAQVSYVKPHGALYNIAAVDEPHARALVSAVRAVDPGLTLLGLPDAVSLLLAEAAGLATAAEAFADRAYLPDGTLAPRSLPGAVLTEPRTVAERMVQLADQGRITAVDGSQVPVRADSVCVHGDSAGAVQLAESVRDALLASGVHLRPFAERQP